MNSRSLEIPDLLNEILPIEWLVPKDDLQFFSQQLTSQHLDNLATISSEIEKNKRIGIILPNIMTEFNMAQHIIDVIQSEVRNKWGDKGTLTIFERREIIEEDYKKRVNIDGYIYF